MPMPESFCVIFAIVYWSINWTVGLSIADLMNNALFATLFKIVSNVYKDNSSPSWSTRFKELLSNVRPFKRFLTHRVSALTVFEGSARWAVLFASTAKPLHVAERDISFSRVVSSTGRHLLLDFFCSIAFWQFFCSNLNDVKTTRLSFLVWLLFCLTVRTGVDFKSAQLTYENSLRVSIWNILFVF